MGTYRDLPPYSIAVHTTATMAWIMLPVVLATTVPALLRILRGHGYQATTSGIGTSQALLTVIARREHMEPRELGIVLSGLYPQHTTHLSPRPGP